MLAVRNDVTKVKEINVELVKNSLIQQGEATKAMIAGETGISIATTGKILNELCATGEAQEVAVTRPGYGRPSKSYSYNAFFKLVACLYVSVNNNKITLSYVVSNLVGGIVEEINEQIDWVDYNTLVYGVRRILDAHDKVSVVSVGVPANLTNGVVGITNFKEFAGLNIGSMLQDAFPEIHIIVENDMNASAYGFYKRICTGSDSIIGYIFTPFGVSLDRGQPPALTFHQREPGIEIGGGFVAGGRILRGFSGFAGEVWFLPVHNVNATPDSSLTATELANVFSSIIPVLNPECIAISGGEIDPGVPDAVRRHCERIIPPEHLPKIVVRENIHDDYINGLISLALEHLSCDVQLVKRDV